MSKTMTTKFEALYIDPLCLKKIQYWADAAVGEVSGLGIVSQEEDRMVVRDVYILEQECSAADTELDPEAISKLMADLIRNDKDPAKLKFWWHSHVNMGVFWSGTDDSCAETLSREYAFSTVVNKKGESKTRLDLYNPFRITVDNIKLIELSAEDEGLKEQCANDVKEKVRRATYSSNINKHQRYNAYGYNNSYYDDDYYNHWNKEKVMLKDEVVADIERLADKTFGGGYTQEILQEFIKELVLDAADDLFSVDTGCVEGVGSCVDENDEVCKVCKVLNVCKSISEKYPNDTILFEDDSEENDDSNNDGDIEVIVDADNTGGN